MARVDEDAGADGARGGRRARRGRATGRRASARELGARAVIASTLFAVASAIGIGMNASAELGEYFGHGAGDWLEDVPPSTLARAWTKYDHVGVYNDWTTVGNGVGLGNAPGDQISAVWVKEGYRLRLWQHPNRKGLVTTFYGGFSNLAYNPGGWMNDKASDADVELEAPCTIFQHDRGTSDPGMWFDATSVGHLYTNLGGMDNKADSVYVAPGYKCTLYKDIGEGTSVTYYPGWHMYHDLNNVGLRDHVSSMRVDYAPGGYNELASDAKALAWKDYQTGTMSKWDNTGNSLDVGTAGGNTISSVWVKKGYRLRLWDGASRTGAVATFYEGYTNLYYRGEWLPDRASDVDVEYRAPCTVFDGDVGSGAWYDLWEPERMYSYVEINAAGMDNKVNSLYVAPGYKCLLWTNDASDELSGNFFTFYPGWHYHTDVDWGVGVNAASSWQVRSLTQSAEEKGCYPAQVNGAMIFAANSNEYSHRVDVGADGTVKYIQGNGRHVWTFINNIVYAMKGRQPLALESPWVNYGGGYASASYSCSDGIVSIGGLIRGGAAPSRIAILPNGCRPTQGVLIFNGATAPDKIVSIEIHTNGHVLVMTTPTNYISLEGIHFATSGLDEIALHNNWINYNAGFAPARIFCGWHSRGIVMLSGMIRGGSWGSCMAYLPKHCRTTEHHSWSVNNHANQARVQIRSSDGCVYWVAGGRDHGWLSLSGITFVTGRKERASLDRWYNYDSSHAPAMYACAEIGGLAVVQGLIRPHAWGGNMFKLPAPPSSTCPMSSPKRLVFTGNQGGNTQRLDFKENSGDIEIVGGFRNNAWSSISSIKYANSQQHSLSMVNGWYNYGGAHAPLTYTCSGGVVTVSGLIKAGKWGHCIAYLPPNCRPFRDRDLKFSINNHENQARVNVRGSDGCIYWNTGGQAHGWISLSGIIFSTTQNRDLQLENGWKVYGGQWARPAYSCVDGLVILSGLAKDGRQNHIATLPPGCRPKGGDLIFQVNHHQYQWRVNVRTNGKIDASGLLAHSWVSLSGIAFSTSDTPHTLKLRSDWAPYGSGWAPPTFSCDRGILSLQGLVTPTRGAASQETIGRVEYASPPPPSPSPPPPPPPSPPPPPPPSPPPPGAKTGVTVSLRSPARLVSTFSYDFGVLVTHPTSCNGDCFESEIARQNARAGGLRCEVRVQKDGVDCDGKWTNAMPCRSWTDFQPRALEMTDKSGKLVSGTYSIKYSCYFVLNDDKTHVHPPAESWKSLHTFQLLSGCSDNIPAGNAQNPLENVARHLLLTSDEFNVADCRDQVQIYKAKEAIFRRYDNDPEDGKLSRTEITAALKMQSADTHIMSAWDEELDGALELKPSQVMRAKTNDMECGEGLIVFDGSVYPTDSPGRESTEEQCRQNATAMRVTWRYTKPVTLGDYACLFVDGMMYDKRSAVGSSPNSRDYSLVDGVYVSTELTDIRPVSGSYEDTQESLIANFLFDDASDAHRIVSASTPVSGDKNRGVPDLTPVDRPRTIDRCEGGDGALCLKPVKSPGGARYSYRYGDFDFTDDVAVTSWVYGTCGGNAGTDTQKMTIAYFVGTNGGVKHVLQLYLKPQGGSLSLIVEYAQSSKIDRRLEISGISCRSWSYVGFALNSKDGLVLFANPTGNVGTTSDSASYKRDRTMPPNQPRKMLKLMSQFELFGAVDVEFDDTRVYTGQVSRATFIDSYNCGHRPVCAIRAHATPASRRVVCASVVLAGQPLETHAETFCTAALYYDGSAIDVMATLGMSGVTFTYRDTSWQEVSFEMLRKSAADVASSYETVIQMDGDLLGCVNKFSSITYMDRDAGTKPNLLWYYKVRTKTSADVQDFVSTTHFFKVPWIGELEGKVTAGSSTSPVPYVRICADFSFSNGTLVTPKSDTVTRNLALYMRAEHTNAIHATAREDTFVVTDGDPSPESGSSLISQGEYLRVQLARWSSIHKVQVCVTKSSVVPEAHVQDYDSGNDGNHGHACAFDESSTTLDATYACYSYKCEGSRLKSFHGKFITVSVPWSNGVDGSLPMEGMYAWFESQNASAVWHSSVGTLKGEVVGGEVTVKTEAGHGATHPVRALHGDSKSKYDFGRAIPAGKWTLCTLSRYTGANKRRIFEGTGNFLHGHWYGLRGVAFYDAWVTSHQVGHGVVDDWLVMCGTNDGKRAYVDGTNVALSDRSGASSDKYLGINYAKDCGDCASERETSDWAVAEVMIWSRALSDAEMIQVTNYLQRVKLGPKAQITEISTSAVQTNCRFSSVTDANGQYEFVMKDTSETIPAKTTVLVGAYKEETFPLEALRVVESSSRAEAPKPSQVLLVLIKQTGSTGRSATPRQIATVDTDKSTSVSRSELQAHIEAITGFPTTGRAIIVDSLWNEFDSDGDGFLSVAEFNAVSVKMRTGELKVDPLLVYPVLDAKYLSDFVEESTKCAKFALIREGSAALPRNSTDWNTVYQKLVSSQADPLAATHRSCDKKTTAISPIGDARLTHIVPLLGSGPSGNLISLAADAASPSEADIYARVIKDASSSTVLRATQRYDDITHIFSTGLDSDTKHFDVNMFSSEAKMNASEVQFRHRSTTEMQFQDQTTVIVRGAVIFPKSRTAGSTRCGLYEASIKVNEVDGEGEPEEYKTDESGWFEIAVTRGKSFTFSASFPNHTLCYTGRTVADAAMEVDCSTHPMEFTFVRIIDNAYIFFTDVTKGNIDLGLYQGQCETLYKGARFKITPVNGCHPSQYVTSDQIGGWMANTQGLPEGKFTTEEPLPTNARVWPFAPMDYSIILDSGPDLGPLGEKIKNEPWFKGCQTEDGSVVDFFRRRNALERLALLRNENAWQQIRYKYHGWICVDIPEAYVPVIGEAYKDTTCYDPSQPSGSLTPKHFVGASHATDLPFAVESSREIHVKVFEVHSNPSKETGYDTCFAALPNKAKGTGSTVVKIRQDVTNPDDSECHSERGGGVSCDFDVELTKDSGELIFPQANATGAPVTAMMIEAGAPNLAGTHRRTVSVEVTRNDLFVSVATKAIRELIALGSRPRVGDGLSNSVNWATVPLEGLVYCVVHDPPGGDSYAELSSGTQTTIEYSLASSRAAKVGGKFESESKKGGKGKFKLGLNLGYTAEASTEILNGEFEGGVAGKAEFKAPEFSVSSSTDEGWDIVLTTQRTLRSSQDPELPGRAGDVILGAGVELVYTTSDVLDFSPKRDGKHCLVSAPHITWMPRKPTSYVVNVHEIEAKIIPNLKFLQSAALKGNIAVDNSLRPLDVNVNSVRAVNDDWAAYIARKIDAWNRTLSWSSPVDDAALNSILGSYTGPESMIGSLLGEKIEEYTEHFEETEVWSLKDGPMFDLAKEWMEYASLEAAQVAPALAGSALISPSTAGMLTLYTAISGPLVFASEARLLPFMEYDGPASIIKGSRKEVIPDYDEQLRHDSEEGSYSFAMQEAAKDARWTPIDSEGSSLDAGSAERIVASLTGGTASTGVQNVGQAEGEKGDIFLTFSGGGHSMDFSFYSDEILSDSSYAVSLEVSGGFDVGGEFEIKSEVSPGFEVEFKTGAEASFERSIGRERAFAWNKRGLMTTTYTLGDPDLGDKFVVHVGADKRFGTPLFKTMGGRSKCPGELGTVFRESSVKLMVPLSTGVPTEGLNPSQRAIYEIVVENYSPYRESSKFALRVVDGLRSSIDEVITAAYDASDADKSSSEVAESVKTVAALTIAKSSEMISSMVSAAEQAAANKTPREVADAVYNAAKSAPYQGSELADSIFSINGKVLSIGDSLPLKFVEGDSLTRQTHISQLFMNLAVEPGYSTRNIKYLQLSLVSLCESEMINLYRDAISFTRNLNPMSWEQSCPKVQFDQSTVSKYLTSSVSPETSSVLSLVVNNPDRYVLWPDSPTTPSDPLMNTRLKFVRLQYRPVKGGEWITAKDEGAPAHDSKKFNFVCALSRSDGCRFDWDTNGQYEKLLSGFKDGVYELRVKSFCGGASSLADASVHEYVSDQRLLLTVDTVAPVRLRTFSEAQYFGAEFSEEIDCSGVNVYVTKKRSDCSDSAATMSQTVDVTTPPYQIRCLNSTGRGVFFFLKFADDDVGQYQISVIGIKDGAGITALRVDNWFKKCEKNGNLSNAPSASSRLGVAPERRRRGASPTLPSTHEIGVPVTIFIALAIASAFAAAIASRRVRLGASTSDSAERAPLAFAPPGAKSGPDYGSVI